MLSWQTSLNGLSLTVVGNQALLATQLATSIVAAHASAGGALEGLCTQWQLQGGLVNRLSPITEP